MVASGEIKREDTVVSWGEAGVRAATCRGCCAVQSAAEELSRIFVPFNHSTHGTV